VAEKRCIDVDFAWVSGLQQQQATAEMTIGRVLGAAGWTYERSNRSSQRYCWGGDGFDEALGEAQQTVGEWLALRWEERGGRRMRPAAPLTEVQREAHRVVGSWVVTLVEPSDA
jgi:hypothetical protein